ncbi:MAG: hypothetical protein NT096_07340 [Proteobacteria bacterium]|nr:hypothetical protein [Pseudomonadota bacterium]
MILDILKSIWGYKIQVLPILCAFSLIEIPHFIRRWKKLYYVPNYFVVFPFNEINQDLSLYLADDYFLGQGQDLSETEIESTRKRIITTSIVSFILTAVLTPLFAGFVSAFFLTKSLMYQFLLIYLVYKAYHIINSFYFTLHHVFSTRRNLALIIATYIVFFGVTVEMFRTAFNWASPFIISKNWTGLGSALLSMMFGKFIVFILIITVLSTLFTKAILDRKFRDDNIHRHE